MLPLPHIATEYNVSTSVVLDIVVKKKEDFVVILGSGVEWEENMILWGDKEAVDKVDTGVVLDIVVESKVELMTVLGSGVE